MTQILDNLRDDVLNASDTTYMTHNIHPYPAKFIPQIPAKIIEEYTEHGDVILDPFCGSGTTLVEAQLHGCQSIGIDVNPIACLASKMKTTVISSKSFEKIEILSKILRKKYDKKEHLSMDLHEFYNKNHWFSLNARREIALILNEIKNIKNQALREFFTGVLSSIAVTVSNQDSDTRYAAVEKNHEKLYVIDLFIDKCWSSSERVLEFGKHVDPRTRSIIHQADSRDLSILDDDSVDLIVTSPPYPNVYDYYLYHKQRMNLLGMDSVYAKDREIGSRLRYSSLKWEIKTFYDDLESCFHEMNRILKPNGYAVIVMGDSIVSGKKFSGLDMVAGIGHVCGFSVVDHVAYDLDSISRVFGTGFRTKNKKEYVVTIQNGS
ncbi:MAG: site-specific DNA-methyltransferase [Alphaproteobacteria bacterium]|nr:site-specific DNA-methyltransferase [Alphaproteobacteria bacterium]